MKKITLLLALFGLFTLNAQVTTGVVDFSTNYSGEIIIDATDVEVTFVGPDDLWLGMGFGVTSMTNGGDAVTFDSTGFNDREFLGIGNLPILDTQDWTVVSNTTAAGIRTLVVTRPILGSDSSDFFFDENAASINLVWARGDNTLVLGGHGQGNRGIDMAVPLTPVLGVNDQALANRISVFPVPASELITVSIDEFNAEEASLEIYSMIGQLVQTETVSHKSTIVDISRLQSGMYILNVNSNDAVATTKIIKK